MEQQGALLKRLAEADSEKAVTTAPLVGSSGYRQPEGWAQSDVLKGCPRAGALALAFLWVVTILKIG
jgi:hypothetical protein